jgi:hypothetical protein
MSELIERYFFRSNLSKADGFFAHFNGFLPFSIRLLISIHLEKNMQTNVGTKMGRRMPVMSLHMQRKKQPFTTGKAITYTG